MHVSIIKDLEKSKEFFKPPTWSWDREQRDLCFSTTGIKAIGYQKHDTTFLRCVNLGFTRYYYT